MIKKESIIKTEHSGKTEYIVLLWECLIMAKFDRYEDALEFIRKKRRPVKANCY